MGGLHKAGRDFITKRTRLNLSCVLEAGFVPLEVVYFEVLFGPGRKGRGNRGLAKYMEEKGGCIARIAGVGENRE